tara:strand:+ start:491 stop:667 length:177 start_codon:yes stop_codon:yes gene_type:complete
MRKIRLVELLRRYKGLSHQVAAINMLEAAIPQELLDRNAEWIECYKCDDYVMKQLPES